MLLIKCRNPYLVYLHHGIAACVCDGECDSDLVMAVRLWLKHFSTGVTFSIVFISHYMVHPSVLHHLESCYQFICM